MSKKYPKSEAQASNYLSDKPAYMSWDTDSEQEKALAFTTYSKALEESSHSVASSTSRDFRGLTTYADGRPGLRASDFDWFRPGQAAPTKRYHCFC